MDFEALFSFILKIVKHLFIHWCSALLFYDNYKFNYGFAVTM